MIRNIFLSILTLIAAAGLLSCDHPTTKDALNQIQGGYDQAKEQLGPVADNVSTMTSEQLNKVIRYEYRVMTIPAGTTPQATEAILAEAGQERWECFSVVPGQNGLTVFCKRLPYALLRSLLKFM